MKKNLLLLPYFFNVFFAIAWIFDLTLRINIFGKSDIILEEMSFFILNTFYIPKSVVMIFFYIAVTIIGLKSKNKIVRCVYLCLTLFLIPFLSILDDLLGSGMPIRTFYHEYKKWW